jgi:hypothetical protein
MSERKTSSVPGTSPAIESIEERQWRLKLEQARAEIEGEERNWETLLARAKTAADTEEREWQRTIARARAKTSGVFPRRQEPAASVSAQPPALPRKR